MASCTAQVDETAFCEQDDVVAVLHEVAIHLGLDVLDALGVLLQPCDVDFDVEMSDVYAFQLASDIMWRP